ncbi:conserved hypothetical protein [Talaromyces stipitatus ATCC 10500]|uniref:Formin GTPase-binding domain-containing protein n=1 Tax=Talaromyces stipitatus (strain ATCC 10500 / CBS 375.48 / QM 6759 / NRRL 1006) TaxID=441959 RepID=B8LWJ8_TALSN|nr:uncharacterized protein TSTA_077550 [Talaromyces stipitatus ATCC 10500]EED24395.1 conserved hypothetical protein [Talaromyces stipitatus ATCC 10500]
MISNAHPPTIFDDTSRPPAKPSMLRSILPSKTHKRNATAGDALPTVMPGVSFLGNAGFLPADHPHAQPLGERAHNRDAAGTQPKKEGLHKKTKSSVSLRSLIKDREKKEKPRSSSDSPDEEGSLGKTMKKMKSTASLSAILKRSNRGRKGEAVTEPKDKENQRPTSEVVSPIWAQFATQPLEDPKGNVYVPGSQRSLEEEVSLYTPKQYSPSKQRNFYDHQPTLVQKPRPKSDYISSGTAKVKEMLGQIQRVPSGKQRNPERQSEFQHSSDSRSIHESKRNSNHSGGRVMAAVSALNAKEADMRKDQDSKQIENEFEKLLDARNIPMNMRDKMRSLDTNIKADFIQKNQAESSCPNSATSSTFDSAGRRGRKDARSGASQTRDKSLRSLSRARSPFPTSRGDASPKKHQKSNSASSFKRPKSVDLSRPYMMPTASTSSTSLHATNPTDTAAEPADFIHYLREVQKPELVEVGKLHKLRLLLRNETVAWVDSFIAGEGMDEIVQLLYRIMKVEWREEHEDNLLHEALLCLKALCTTSVALQRLTALSKELFPALLGMIFDEEKKGPSEFTTRGVIISLLFTHLSTAPEGEMQARAAEILGYLRDPNPNKQQVEFITNIYQSRPYRVWCKEVTNVTKEVFWIFLHHLNVIPLNRDNNIADQEQGDYLKKHFPTPRPPVPAAPYVGGVEWDATNYLATHLDLMNGLIACQPTTEQRNALREDLRASGFEKAMGGSMRTCKEKFYGAVHDCLKTWVAAARDDGWDYRFVREGPEPGSPTKPIKSSRKKPIDEPPKLALDINLEKKSSSPIPDVDGWI